MKIVYLRQFFSHNTAYPERLRDCALRSLDNPPHAGEGANSCPSYKGADKPRDVFKVISNLLKYSRLREKNNMVLNDYDHKRKHQKNPLRKGSGY
jgi:hypothetical protein